MPQTLVSWQPYPPPDSEAQHTVTGMVRILRRFYSPELNNRRDIFVYLPPSYHQSEQRYPVIYMHDGQNLFDDRLSFIGEWQVDETMEALSAEGIEAIVVGVPNMGVHRVDEYGPFVASRMGGGAGERYIAFLADTLKPRIDADFRTLPDRAHTGIMGSSMGGLISLYGFFHRPDTFGLAGVLSPSLWFGAGAIFDIVEGADFMPGKIYLDTGTRERADVRDRVLLRALSRRTYGRARRMYRVLVKKGYRAIHEVRYVEDKGAHHHEAAWARRLPDAIRFLLA